MILKQALADRWTGPGGYGLILRIALPLMVSTGSWSVQHFVDRMFLTWYSPLAIAAVTPAGMLNFAIMSLFIGTAGYVNTFVAQYHGAGRDHRIGPVLWQGLYIALGGGILVMCLAPFSAAMFAAIGHDAAVQADEARYFQILCLGAVPVIASQTMAGFFSGRGVTRPIMWINIIGTLANVILDYLLIFGKFGFPELGITGAAIATVAAAVITFLISLSLVFRADHRARYRTAAGWRLEPSLLGRLLRFGVPNGVQFFLEVAGFTVFILLVGRTNMTALAATNIAINVNSVAFLPMIGLGMAISILVGQHLGDNNPDLAARSVWHGFHITIGYMGLVASLYLFLPGLFLAPYAAGADPGSFTAIRETTVVLLRFVAFYSLFDAMNIVFSYAIKGAGDTTFVMKFIGFASIFILAVPCYIAMVVFDLGIYVGWAITSVFVMSLGVAFLIRFLGGEWMRMRVIEAVPPPMPSSLPEGPGVEYEALGAPGRVFNVIDDGKED